MSSSQTNLLSDLLQELEPDDADGVTSAAQDAKETPEEDPLCNRLLDKIIKLLESDEEPSGDASGSDDQNTPAAAEGDTFYTPDATTQGRADAQSAEGTELCETEDGSDPHALQPHENASLDIAPPMSVLKLKSGRHPLRGSDLKRSVIMAEVLGRPVSLRRGHRPQHIQ